MSTQLAGLKRLAPPLDGFIVDGFNFVESSVRDYFLTHAHSDHTTGLTSAFTAGTIYCSHVTARLVMASLGVSEARLVRIAPGESIRLGPVLVTALDAGHCPGALMFLFHHTDLHYTALHTGDFRASEEVRERAVEALRHL
ncbi:MAG: hypothetical protein SGPRY_009285, partial [Prymnesium sp.]